MTDLALGPDTLDGIPLHPLVVHAAVVLIPLTALGVIVMAIWPKFSRQYGWLVALCSVAAAGASWMARYTGGVLKDMVGAPGFNHESLGNVLPFFATALMIAVLGLFYIDRSAPPDEQQKKRGVRTGVAALAVVVALVSLGWVGLVGHSGSKSVWSGRVATASEVP